MKTIWCIIIKPYAFGNINSISEILTREKIINFNDDIILYNTLYYYDDIFVFVHIIYFVLLKNTQYIAITFCVSRTVILCYFVYIIKEDQCYLNLLLKMVILNNKLWPSYILYINLKFFLYLKVQVIMKDHYILI